MTAVVLALVAWMWQAPTFRSAVDRVQIDVSATRGGRPVPGLGAADFSVTDNGVPQAIESQALEDSALCVQLVLDTSGSVSGPRLQRLIDAGSGLLHALRPADQAGLITFSTAVEIRVPMTADLARVRQSLAGIRGSGATSLRDAVALALEAPSCTEARTMIIVFSDGADTSSWLRDADVVESARRSGLVTHVVAVRAVTVASRLLPDLTDAAGGRIFSASSQDDLARLFTSALSEMRARYLVTFAPRPLTPGWHDLKVRARASGVEVRARPGYFVSAPN